MNDEKSPYETPKSTIIETENKPLEIVPARKILRFVNLIIDYIAFLIIGILTGILVAVIFGDDGIRYMESTPDILIGAPILLLYYIIFESLTGRTLGKLITGTKVVNEEGLKASVGQIIGRSFSRLIPFEGFTFLGQSGRGLHDSLASTFVVKCR